MKVFQYLSLLLIACLLSTAVDAQRDAELDDIITESSEPSEDLFLDDIVQRTLVYESQVLPYEELREADVPWQKRVWRLIDVRERMNLHFRNEEEPFFDILKEAAINGEITVFKGSDKNFTEPMFGSEVQAIIARPDTQQVMDPETFDMTTQITTIEIFASNIERYRIKEVWYFNKEESVVKVRILGIAPMYQEFDNDSGMFIAEYPLFWVYYPQARELLARHRVFNPKNDAAPMTWYDVFEQRQFSSFIWKQSNELDAHLSALGYEGVDLLMESEKIRAELFNFEHDLWSY